MRMFLSMFSLGLFGLGLSLILDSGVIAGDARRAYAAPPATLAAPQNDAGVRIELVDARRLAESDFRPEQAWALDCAPPSLGPPPLAPTPLGRPRLLATGG